MARKQRDADKITTGMPVETTKGDLGEHDISKPRVDEVVRDSNNQVTDVVVKKGAIFRKKIEVPIDRVQQVKPTRGNHQGKVVIDGEEKELEALKEHKEETLATEQEIKQEDEQEKSAPSDPGFWLRMLGPGVLAGMAGNDSSAVAAYAIDGSQAGFGHLWLILLSTPLYQAVQFASAKLGRITQKGLAEVLREHYGRKLALPAVLTLLVANIALITADLVAVSSGLELLTHIAWPWFVVPVAIILWYLVVFSNFKLIKKIFVGLSLAFAAYIVTGILARPSWGDVLINTFVPHISLDFASVSAAWRDDLAL